MYDEKSKLRTMKYLESKREQLKLNLPLGTKEIWRGIAAEHGMSLTSFITKLIEGKILDRKKELIMKNFTEKEAMVKLLNIAGIESDIETMQRFVKDDSLTINTARNGRDVAWMLTETQNIAVYVDSLQQLTEEEIERELM